MVESPGEQGAKAGNKLADIMIRVKIKPRYPPFIVRWLVGRAIKKDRKNNAKIHRKVNKAMAGLIKDLKSKAWRFSDGTK